MTSITVHPASPQAGDTVVLNATGVSGCVRPCPALQSALPASHPPAPFRSALLTGGSGTINAYLFGSDVFTAPVNTCGYTDVDVLGVADGSLYGPNCSPQTPIQPGQQGTISFSMAIPSEGQGLGQLNVIVVRARPQLSALTQQ